jgi:DoxX-like family
VINSWLSNGMNMKSIGYWVATTLISLETFVGGITDLVHGGTELVSGPPVVGVVTHLGYPVYILGILGVWKLLGAVVIVVPGLPRLKEWAYAGVFFELTGAAASYVLHNEITSDLAAPLILAALAMLSWALRPESRVLGSLFPARTTAHVALNATTRG